MTGRMTAADTVCCTSNEEFGGRILKQPFCILATRSQNQSAMRLSHTCPMLVEKRRVLGYDIERRFHALPFL